MVDQVPPHMEWCQQCNAYHFKKDAVAVERAERTMQKYIGQARALPISTLQAIIAVLKNHTTPSQQYIAWVYGLRTRVVTVINARNVVSDQEWRAVTPHAIPGGHIKQAKERDAAIWQRYMAGDTARAIAKDFALDAIFVKDLIQERIWEEMRLSESEFALEGIEHTPENVVAWLRSRA